MPVENMTRKRTAWSVASLVGAGCVAAGLFIVGSVGAAHQGYAMADPPAGPKIDCRKRKNKNKPECRKTQSNAETLSDDEVYQAGYWLARKGNYEAAISTLSKAKNRNDARILNVMGFANRKLGRLDVAMGLYTKALEADPDNAMARAYLGEAHLQQGKLEGARAQLAELKRRCGDTCVAYVTLAAQINSFVSTGRFTEQDKRDAAVEGRGDQQS